MSEDTGCPSIDAGDHDLARVTAAAWEAVKADNAIPYLFDRGGIVVRLDTTPDGRPR